MKTIKQWLIATGLSPEIKHTVETLRSLVPASFRLNTDEASIYLESLTQLFLDKKELIDVSPLGCLTNLKTLCLQDNKISNIEGLKNLVNLESLLLDNNQITDIEPLKHLVNLTCLDLSFNKISDITHLSFLRELEFLSVYENKISDITPLYSLSKLTSLDIRQNFILNELPDDLNKIMVQANGKIGNCSSEGGKHINYDESSLESEFQRYAEVVSKKLKEEMVDPIQAITAGKNALEGIKRLNGYAEEIKDISKRGEFMRIIGELSLQLAETQIRLAEKIQEVEKLNGEIRELNNPVFQLIFDSKLGHYYEANDSGRTKPFCTGCYDKNKKSITLTKMPLAMKELGSRKCPVCNAVYP